MAKTKGKKITRLMCKDVLRLSVVEITPEGNVVTLGGKNRAGKSSVLDAIQMAFAGKASVRQQAGKKVATKKPVHDGAIEGKIVVEMDDLIIERTIFDEDSDKLVVRSREGATYPRPQETLNKLFNSVSFNPLQFVDLEPAKQVETLRRLAGVDFSAIDAERQEAYDQRTIVGRDVATLKGQVEGCKTYGDAPKTPVVVADLLKEIEDIEAAEKEREAACKSRDEQSQKCEQLEAAIQNAKDCIAELEKLIADKQAELKGAVRELEKRVKAAVGAAVPDKAPIKAKLASAEETNRQVRANNEHANLSERHRLKVEMYEDLSGLINTLDEQKRQALASAAFPVDGLSFDDTGVSFNAIPFNQCSRAEQIRISMAIGMALNPDLRVLLVRDASLIDEEGLALLAAIAAEKDYQVWLEDSRTTDPTAIIIEDGHVRQEEKAAE